MLDSCIRVADTTSLDFDYNMARLGLFHRNLFEGEGCSLGLEDGHLVFLWKATHCVDELVLLRMKRDGGVVVGFSGDFR